MAIIGKKVSVRRSELLTIECVVQAWEFPILQMIHGNDAQELGDMIFERDPPDAKEEFQRLERRYGNSVMPNGDIGIPNVAATYGQYNVGLKALERAIADAAAVSPLSDYL